MAISSLDKIIHYINCVCLSDSIIEYEGTDIELKPVESVIISPNMWYKDECKCCGQCCRNYNTVFSDLSHKVIGAFQERRRMFT